ncbi:hypothetical protein ZIOFF_017159 [Zingiber officinale]|uniref:Uncharacterized protein n=1 Tax=Zingiber officinale TaxID=94328 RepID=A0A8J5HNC8_ZINOF|nr:hypothetical protein ZIOFF_017159 [Zingiber officinale]
MVGLALEQVQESGLIAFCLPPLSEDDPLHAEKQNKRAFGYPLLDWGRNLLTNSSIDLVRGTAIELYFAGDDEIGPFSPRNELEPLNFILAHLSSLISNVKYSSIDLLHLVHNTIFAMIKTVGDNNINTMTAKKFGTDSEELVLKWGQDYGLKTMLSITYMYVSGIKEKELLCSIGMFFQFVKRNFTFLLAIDFEEAGRGSVALEDMSIGDIALEIPEPLIISEDLVYNSDMFDVLKKLDDITPEIVVMEREGEMVLIRDLRRLFYSWSLLVIGSKPQAQGLQETLADGGKKCLSLMKVEEHQSLLKGNSLKFHWRLMETRSQRPSEIAKVCNPISNRDGEEVRLSFQVDAFASLEGTLLFEELSQSKEACELWYSNSMKVIFGDGKLRTCVVPIAGFLNHLLCPQIVHCGRVDPVTKSLKFPVIFVLSFIRWLHRGCISLVHTSSSNRLPSEWRVESHPNCSPCLVPNLPDSSMAAGSHSDFVLRVNYTPSRWDSLFPSPSPFDDNFTFSPLLQVSSTPPLRLDELISLLE